MPKFKKLSKNKNLSKNIIIKRPNFLTFSAIKAFNCLCFIFIKGLIL